MLPKISFLGPLIFAAFLFFVARQQLKERA